MAEVISSSDEDRVHVVGDKPAGEDLLGYSPYIDSLAKVLLNPTLETPFVVGVFGPWGTGKSTFMDLLGSRLAANSLDTLPFRPWQFEEKEFVWKALILSVLSYLEGQKTVAEKDRDRLAALLKNVAKLAIDKSVQAVTGDRMTLDDFVEVYAEAAQRNARFINTFRREFEEIKTDILGHGNNPNGRLIIFVDDLDRCTPENCIMVLEAIKLFFDASECIFVIGIDREVVQKGIDHKYQKISGISGQEYLEKIIQLPFTLPPVADGPFLEFARKVTREFGFDQNIVGLLIGASDKNPRRLKRMANCLSLVDTVSKQLAANPNAPHIEKSIDRSQLAYTLIIQIRFPVCHRWLADNPSALIALQSGELSDKSEAQLLAHLTRAYGEEYAEYALGRFKSFVKDITDAESIPEFDSIQAVQATLQITGLVNEPRGAPPPKTSDIYDNAYQPLEQEEPGPRKSRPRRLTSSDEDADAVQAAEKDLDEVIKEWEWLTGRSAFGLLLTNSNTHVEKSLKLARGAKVLANHYKTLKEEGEIGEYHADNCMAKLAAVNMSAISSQLNSALQYLMLLLPTSLIVISIAGLLYGWFTEVGATLSADGLTIQEFAVKYFGNTYLIYLSISMVLVLLTLLRARNLRTAIVRIKDEISIIE